MTYLTAASNHSWMWQVNMLRCGPDNSVGVTTPCVLDGPEIESIDPSDREV